MPRHVRACDDRGMPAATARAASSLTADPEEPAPRKLYRSADGRIARRRRARARRTPRAARRLGAVPLPRTVLHRRPRRGPLRGVLDRRAARRRRRRRPALGVRDLGGRPPQAPQAGPGPGLRAGRPDRRGRRVRRQRRHGQRGRPLHLAHPPDRCGLRPGLAAGGQRPPRPLDGDRPQPQAAAPGPRPRRSGPRRPRPRRVHGGARLGRPARQRAHRGHRRTHRHRPAHAAPIWCG